MTGPFDAIIFDCDGVLADTEGVAEEVALRMLAAEGLHYTPQESQRFVGLSWKAWGQLVDRDALERLGRPLPPSTVQFISSAITKAILRDVRPIEGAVAAVRAIALPKGVASSSPTFELHEKMRALGLWDLLSPHIHGADDVAHAKPAPDLYLLAANQLNVSPSRCLVIEDSVPGVTAGVAAGMTVWGFTGGPHLPAGTPERLIRAGAVKVVNCMAELQTLINGPSTSGSR
jgi:beta-phosphoglucomutase-like phosphatase (HAD superfamily)